MGFGNSDSACNPLPPYILVCMCVSMAPLLVPFFCTRMYNPDWPKCLLYCFVLYGKLHIPLSWFFFSMNSDWMRSSQAVSYLRAATSQNVSLCMNIYWVYFYLTFPLMSSRQWIWFFLLFFFISTTTQWDRMVCESSLRPPRTRKLPGKVGIWTCTSLVLVEHSTGL